MEFFEPILLDGLASYMWPMVRIAGFLMAIFMISGSSVPTMVRALFAMTLTFCVLPSIPHIPTDLQLFSVNGIITTLNQVIIGVGIGFMTQFIAQAFIIAGQIVAMQTGLGFASLIDPVSGTNAPVVGQFFSILVTFVFFAIDGHLIFIRLLLLSFHTIPIGPHYFAPDALTHLFMFGSVMFQCALAMSISAVCTMLIVNFTFGVMTKAAPQLNVFSMGFSVAMVVGFFVLVATLSAFMGNFYNAFSYVTQSTCQLMGTVCEF